MIDANVGLATDCELSWSVLAARSVPIAKLHVLVVAAAATASVLAPLLALLPLAEIMQRLASILI